ncbi:MAG: outer membrane beta-barrel protein [Chitinophagaceae bacterium]
MKQVVKITVLFFISIVSVHSVQAQLHLNLTYNLAMPQGADFRDHINNTSLRGWQGSLLYDINDNFRVGLQTSYNDFYQKHPRQVYKSTDGADVSTVLSNSLQMEPVFAKGEYSFLKTGFLRPYIGLGAGVNFADYRQFQGAYGYSTMYTKAAFTGDAGVLIPIGKNSDRYGVRINTSYNYLPFHQEGINNLNSWNVGAGIVIPLR